MLLSQLIRQCNGNCNKYINKVILDNITLLWFHNQARPNKMSMPSNKLPCSGTSSVWFSKCDCPRSCQKNWKNSWKCLHKNHQCFFDQWLLQLCHGLYCFHIHFEIYQIHCFSQRLHADHCKFETQFSRTGNIFCRICNYIFCIFCILFLFSENWLGEIQRCHSQHGIHFGNEHWKIQFCKLETS